MSRNADDLEQVKAHLTALSQSLPELIERLRGLRADAALPDAALPDAEKERHRLAAFAAYLDHYGPNDARIRGPISVREVLEGAVALASGELAQTAEVEATYEDCPLVYANPRQLGQVFVSLLINAAQANATSVAVHLDTSAPGWARVRIADSGSGIAPEVLPHIFEALYSTKRGAGMGVGLAIVREIVTHLGGRINVESELGRGTTFTIDLPPSP